MEKQLDWLRKLVKNTCKDHEIRSNQIREDIGQVWKQTESMKEQIFNLMIQMDKIDDAMGTRYLN